MPLSEPARHTRARQRAERLDPVRRRGPRRGTLMRLVAVTVLLLTSAAVLWSRPAVCTPAAPGASSPPHPSGSPIRDGSAGSTGSTRPTGPPAIPAGSVGVPVRLADPTALGVVRPGDRVDLLRLDDSAGRPVQVAGGALVLDVTGADDPATGGLLVALGPAEAERAVTTSGRGFAVLIRAG